MSITVLDLEHLVFGQKSEHVCVEIFDNPLPLLNPPYDKPLVLLCDLKLAS